MFKNKPPNEFQDTEIIRSDTHAQLTTTVRQLPAADLREHSFYGRRRGHDSTSDRSTDRSALVVVRLIVRLAVVVQATRYQHTFNSPPRQHANTPIPRENSIGRSVTGNSRRAKFLTIFLGKPDATPTRVVCFAGFFSRLRKVGVRSRHAPSDHGGEEKQVEHVRRETGALTADGPVRLMCTTRGNLARAKLVPG